VNLETNNHDELTITHTYSYDHWKMIWTLLLEKMRATCNSTSFEFTYTKQTTTYFWNDSPRRASSYKATEHSKSTITKMATDQVKVPSTLPSPKSYPTKWQIHYVC